VGRNGTHFFNRPLYIANTNAFVLAGDRPALRFGSGETLHGTLFFGVVRGKKSRWLHAATEQTLEYRAAHARWVLRDRAFAGLTLTLDAVASEREVGFAVKVTAVGARAGDRLVWVFGGARMWPDKPLNWELDPHREPPLIPVWFDPALCAGNEAGVEAGGFSLAPAGTPACVTRGCCDATGAVAVRDAAQLESPAALLASAAAGQPVLAGETDLAAQPEVHWNFVRVERGSAVAPQGTPVEAFAAGLARSAALTGRIVVETPEPRLNAAAAVLPAAIDGAWYPPLFRHGAMLWNVRYPGWRTVFGGTVLGWHERVKAQAEFYLGHQVTSSEKRSLAADPTVQLTIPAKDSRFYGRGRILEDQGIYNMQSQFFDQLIHAWRWTGDAELEALLRPALELHLKWLSECFDPDGDGLYESFINVWPTDSVWYAGGGATEETSYAFRAHAAAQDLARRAGDAAAAKRHAKQLARIRGAFRKKLWIAAKGRAGLYQEQATPQRLHEDAWLYSIFLPIDAGLVSTEQAAESLLYTERSLQNDSMPCGGRMVWTSNFVPAIWSVRERWPGDNHHLALAYFQAGLAEDGWEIFRGSLLHTAFDHLVPGDFGAPAGGTDFGDSTHMAARTLVEGLFGCAPDRAHGVVRLTPQLPAAWEHASLRTPDVTLRYARRGPVTKLAVELPEPARLEIRLPVCARGIAGVTVNGRPARWTAEPGFGRTFVRVALPATREATIEVKVKQPAAVFGPVKVAGNTGGKVVLRAKAGVIRAFSDPQGVLAGAAVRRGAVAGRLTANAGAHTVIARVQCGELPQLRRFHVQISDPAAEKVATAKNIDRAPARANWQCVDLAPALNGDIRTIYSQQYLSPRPATMSARIGTDGYTPWTFPYWNSFPPVIKLDGVPALLEGTAGDRLRTPQGVPFAWPGEARNIAFTSRWDNWPDKVTVPVDCAGDAVWFLVCGSTNPMQGHIANAVLRLRYARGAEDALELVPPFNYWNLSPIRPVITAPGQGSRFDYTAETDAFCVPKPWPQTVQLGENCRAMLLGRRLRRGAALRSVTLETLSAEVVVGLMGVTVMNPR
jgi:hypothetical protein